MSALSNFFARRRTIESITAPITNIVSKLEKHADIHTDKASKHDVAAAIHAEARENSKRETERARVQAENFARMVG